MKKVVVYLFLGAVIAYLFVVYDVGFHGPDEPIYYAYTASVVEDGDLNAVNHLNEKYPYYLDNGCIGVSKTYNLPDYHNHGGVVFWVPFYVYAKIMHYLISHLTYCNYNVAIFINSAMSFSTVIFGFFSMLLTFLFSKKFFSNKISLYSIVMIFFGTPFFYFLIYETGNAQALALFLSIVSIWFFSYILRSRSFYWFIYGIFFSICIAVKIDIWFQLVFILIAFVLLAFFRKVSLKQSICFIFGLIPGILLKIINDYIKYGVLYFGEFKLLNLKSFYFFEQLFSRYHGFFYTSPIFYLCLIGLVIIGVSLLKRSSFKNEDKMRDIFILVLTSYLMIKIFILSFRYAWGGGTPGARILLTEFPVFVLLYARALQAQKKVFRKIIFLSLSCLFVIWNIIIISEFIAKVDLNYIVNLPSIWNRIKMVRFIVYPLFYPKDIILKLYSCLPLVLIIFIIVFKGIKNLFIGKIWYWNKTLKISFKPFFLFTAYISIAYLVVTGLNVYNNKNNVKKMLKNNMLENTKVIFAEDFERRENVGSLNEMIEYYSLIDDSFMLNKLRKIKNNF